ncbi:MAG TPA: hypothetical protein ENJ95_01480 [Bacteroidetes bacterium]|nr:hypothetical protein [Bacteroidota bacterium]
MKSNKKAIHISDLHFEHKNWKSEILFWKDELQTFQHRLEEVVQRWTDTDILAQAEHFQNQFIRHNEVLDKMLHDVREHEQQLAKFAEEHPVAIDHRHFGDHAGHRENMDIQRKIYNELKKEFFAFLAKTM